MSAMEKAFNGRAALVTGAARGIGAAIAKELHARGAFVAVSDRDIDGANQVASTLDSSNDSAIGIELDVRDRSAFVHARDVICEMRGGVDILVNNAAFNSRRSIAEITGEDFDAASAVNLKGTFFGCQVFAEHQKARGYGRIVNIGSLSAQTGGTLASAHYASTKAGILTLTKIFARELADSGVTVNAVAPGPIETAMPRLSPEQIADITKTTPLGRFGYASEVAVAVAYLVSEQAGFVTGATIDVNGGLSMR